ncbi:MAG: ABC transporter ATP-binding protein/permease, partial [Acetobacteraceae bacterium]|nr:ABC transporter ATP-binding protein/permease [Acetobacteraceae bacterium]
IGVSVLWGVGQFIPALQGHFTPGGDIAATTDIATLLVVGVIIFSFDWKLSLASLACLPLFLGAFHFFRRHTRDASTRVQVQLAEVSSELQSALAGVKDIQANWAFRNHLRRFRERLRSLMGASVNQQLLQTLSTVAVSFIGALGPVVVLSYGTLLVLAEKLTVGQLVAFNSYLTFLFGPSQRLASLNINLQTALAAARRVFEYLDEPISDGPSRRGIPLIVRRGELAFEQLHFHYEPHRPVLRGVSFTVPGGAVAALVGPSGAGKTTVANLLIRLYRPAAGRITVDGVDIATVNVASLRLQIGIVSQDTVIFAGPIAENIAYARPGASWAEIEAAARAAGVDTFASKLPLGLQQPVGEHGVTLSLGQRQRVAIARALLKRPRILILDEATSGLDPESEAQIWEMLRARMAGRTILVITHRLLSVTDADMTFVIDGGRIVETGRPDDLLERRGVYWRLFQDQFRPEAAT